MDNKYNFLFYSWCTSFNYIPSSEFYSIINRLKWLINNKIIIDSITHQYYKFTKTEFEFYYNNIDLFINDFFNKIWINKNLKIDYFIANNMWFNESIPEILLIAKALKKEYWTIVIIASEFAKYYWDYLIKYYWDCVDFVMDWWDARYVPEEQIYSIIINDEKYFLDYMVNLDEEKWYNQFPDFSYVYWKTDIIEFEISRWCKTFPKCFYCWASYIKSFHSRSLNKNKELLDEFKNNWIKKIYFVCNEINFDNNYFEKFLDILIKWNYNFKWSCYILAKNLWENLIKKMKLAWCEHVKIGIESVSKNRSNTISKRLNIIDLEKIIRQIHNNWIIVQWHFMYNFKNEDINELKDQMLFIEKNKEYLDIVDFHYLKFRPRSQQYKEILKFHYPKFLSNNNLINLLNIDKFDLPFVQDNYYVDNKGNLKRAFFDKDILFLKKKELLLKFLIKIWKNKIDWKISTDPKKFFIEH